MKTMQFQVLLDELGGLSAIQRAALMVALKSSNSTDDVTSLLEVEFAKAPACGHCGAESFNKWSVATGMKRYMCKTCNRPSTRSQARRWRICTSARSGWSMPAPSLTV